MKLIIYPGNALRGSVQVPGDKSLSHRAVLFAALAEGESRISNFLVSGVTRVMLDALKALGVEWKLDGEQLIVQGQGLRGLQAPAQPLYCGNSATTIRFLAGALAAAGIPAVLDGSDGLRKRPMDRIVEPLRRMGVQIHASGSGTAPLTLSARPESVRLLPLNEDLPVASAQVKTCLLLAALDADGGTVLREPGPSRDHTERMLGRMGVDITSQRIEMQGRTAYETRLTPAGGALKPLTMAIPGDFSAAAFFIAVAAFVPGSEVMITGVEINPTRTGIIDALRAMGADIAIEERGEQGGEPVGNIFVRASNLTGGQVSGDLVVRMIDEFSAFGAAAAFAQGETCVRDAVELRYKESDRISTLCDEIRKLGGQAEEAQDGFRILGGGLQGGAAQAHGDHRLAMALATAGLAARAPVTIDGAEIISESFPGFVEALCQLGANVEWVSEGKA